LLSFQSLNKLSKLKIFQMVSVLKEFFLTVEEWLYKNLSKPGIAKIGLTPGLDPPAPQSWHSGGFDEKSAQMRLTTF